jgi:predicted nucleic acid-binding protein
MSVSVSMVRRATDVSSKARKKQGEEHLQRVIDMCKSVEQRGLDPFTVDVEDLIAVVRDLFPEWKSMEEFSLDFDHAYEYVVAHKYDLAILGFDTEFDWTSRGSRIPSEIR